MASINTFFLRVAARCNLSCDYCYVFRHRDMSWKQLPAYMDIQTVHLFAQRLREYLLEEQQQEANIIFHGGEPLIVGAQNIINYTDIISDAISDVAKVSFSLQTNGTLIDKDFLDKCETRNIGVSLSLDGHADVHNKHRRFAAGGGSFDSVYENLKLLQAHPSIFEGIIGVIDPVFDPEEILLFFSENKIMSVDMLLPDSTYQDPPLGRHQNPMIYENWLITAFDLWFTKYQSIRFRTFEHILKGLMGIESSLDSFGLGELDYLTIESDGSYHTTDILKSTFENASSLGTNLTRASIAQVLEHEKISEYNRLLSWSNLPDKCKNCTYSHICGGGSLPHRFSLENGFHNPTVYCKEMFSLISHAEGVLRAELDRENTI